MVYALGHLLKSTSNGKNHGLKTLERVPIFQLEDFSQHGNKATFALRLPVNTPYWKMKGNS